MANWWVIVPPAEANAAKIPGDGLIISTQDGSDFDNALFGGATIAYQGKQYTRLMGPFTSGDAARKATPSTHLTIKDLIALGEAGALAAGGNAAAAGGGATIGNPLGGIDKLAAVVEASYKAITDGKLWRSLAWLILGVLILAGGLIMLIGKSDTFRRVAGAASLGRL